MSTTSRPFNRITRYNTHSFTSTTQPVHVIVKCSSHFPSITPLHNSFLYTIPFKNDKRELGNAILSFVEKDYATYYLDSIKKDSYILQNKNEPSWSATVMTYSVDEVSYYAYILGLPVIVIHSLYCDDKIRDPVMELSIANTIVDHKYLLEPPPKNMY